MKLLLGSMFVAVGVFLFSNVVVAQTVQKKILIDLGSSNLQTSGWNNLTNGSTGAKLSSLIDTTGASTGASLEITDSFWQGWIGAANGNGTTSNSLYPSSAASDSLFIGNHQGSLDDTAKIRLSGLNPNASYTLKFFASRMANDDLDRSTIYMVKGQSKELQARNNETSIVDFSNLVATDGVLDITIALKSGAVYGYLGVLEIIENLTTTTTPPPPTTGNLPPIVTVATNTPIITLPTNSALLQSASSDPDGAVIAGKWTQVSGPSSATISTPGTAWTTVTGLIEGLYTFRQTVTDHRYATASADITITVKGNGIPAPINTTPTASAGTDKTITLPTTSVTLSGSGTDSDGTIASYAWSKVSGGAATISSPSAASTAITSLAQGTYTFRLTVTDNKGASAADDVVVMVNAAIPTNLSPIVDAGTAITIPQQSNTAVLDPIISDPEGKAVTQAWSQVAGPSQASFFWVSWAKPVAYNLVPGTYTFRVIATDVDGMSATDTVDVKVTGGTGTGTPSMRTVTHKSVVAGGKTIYYYESLPKGYNTDPNRKYPLVVFHHGVGERGSTLASLPNVINGLPITTSNLEFNNDSFIVMMPQLHESYGDWQDFFTQAMIDAAKSGLRVDTDRVYLIGYSLGGFQTWMFPQRSDVNASQIAAIAPIAGGRYTSTGVCKIATNKLGVWAFHATNDGTVGVSTTDNAINALNACSPAPNPAPKYTRYTSGDHWIPGWATDPNAPLASNLWQWLLTQKRAAPVVPNTTPTASAGTDKTITLPTTSVTLSGSGTDSDGTIASYAWSKVSGGAATISSPSAASTAITSLAQGTYTFRLTVTDNKGASAADDVVVMVNAATTGLNPAVRTLTAHLNQVPAHNFYGPQGSYLSLPRGYNNDTTRTYPLLVFLHGIGERGNGTTELPRVLGQGTPKEIANGAQLEYTVNGKTETFIVAIPQLQGNASEWHPYHVDNAIEYAKKNSRVDTKRIYVAGLSLGAFGTWRYPEFSLEYANKVAALVPSDGANVGTSMYTPDYPGLMAPLNQCHISNSHLPIWAHYGTADGWAYTVTGALQQLSQCSPAANPAPIVTTYAGAGHGVWGTVFKAANPSSTNIYEWLLTKSR